MREATVSIGEADLEAMGLDGLVAVFREAGLVDLEEFACYGNGAVVRADVETRLEEDRVAALEPVDRVEHVAERAGTHAYLVAFTSPAIPESMRERAGALVGTCDPDVDERGATMSLVGPQDAIADALSEYERAGVSPDLRRLGGYRGPDRPLAELTDRQREVLRAAWEAGYYEVPSEATTEDVAADLGLDPSTVAEHLQRAERNLLAVHL